MQAGTAGSPLSASDVHQASRIRSVGSQDEHHSLSRSIAAVQSRPRATRSLLNGSRPTASPGNLDRIDPHVVPPGCLVAASVKLAMMGAAKRHREVIADLASHGPRLGKANVMSIGGRGAAQQAGLRGDVAEMLLVADAQGLAEGQGALVDALPELAHNVLRLRDRPRWSVLKKFRAPVRQPRQRLRRWWRQRAAPRSRERAASSPPHCPTAECGG